MSNELLTPSQIKSSQMTNKFGQLYEIYFPRIYAYVSYRVSDRSDVEDLVAEVFYKVAKGINSFEWRGEQAFTVWIFRVARHLISNFYRQHQRWNIPLSIEDLPELPAGTLLPEELVLLSQARANLQTLIKTLSPRQQDVIALKYFGGMGNKEIAAVLELEERTVAAYLCRGLKSLQQKCGDRSQDLEDWKIWMDICDEQKEFTTNASSPMQHQLISLSAEIINLVPQSPELFKKRLKQRLFDEVTQTKNQKRLLQYFKCTVKNLWR